MNPSSLREIFRTQLAGSFVSARSAVARTLGYALVGVFGVGLGFSVDAQQRVFDHYNNDDGLPQTQCLTIFQDSRGYMWFGTYGGVARYDGNRFVSFTAADGLSGNVVRAIAEDAEGGVLIGTEGGISVIREGVAGPLAVERPRAIGAVTDLLVTDDGEIWAATATGLVVVQGGKANRYTIADGLPSDTILSLLGGDSLGLWVGTAGGLARLRDGRFESIPLGFASAPEIHALQEFQGTFWIATSIGAYRWDGDSTRPAIMVSPPRNGGLAMQASAVVDGDIWFGAAEGALVLSPQGQRWVGAEHGLGDPNINALWVDAERSMWLGTDDGVYRFGQQQFVFHDERDGLPSRFVRDVAAGPDGTLLLATRDGAAVRAADGSFGRLQGAPEGRANAILSLPDGTILIGTELGLVVSQNGRRELLTTADGLPNNGVRALLADANGVWIGTRGGLARWDGARLQPVPQPLREPLLVIDLATDLRGRLWVATFDRGLKVFDGRSLHAPPGLPAALSTVAIWSLDVAPDGTVWVGTNGHGAYGISADGVTHLSRRDGLVNDFVWQILASRDGELWLYTNRGLDRWRNGSYEHFRRADGLPDLEGSLDAAFEDERGRLWFGTVKGLAEYRPLDRVGTLPPPPIAIERASAGRAVLDAGGTIERGQRRQVSFAYAGLTFNDRDAVRYRYRLVGLIDEWSAATRERQVTFDNLRPGTYTFEVMALSHGMSSSEPARFDFHVDPELTETSAFRAAATLALILVVCGVYLWRHNQVERDRIQLRTRVAERTRELADSERRFRVALSGTPTCVFHQDPGLRYSWVENDCFGHSPADVLGRRDGDFFEEPHEATELEGIKRSVLVSGRPLRSEISATLNSEVRHYDVSLAPQRDSDGQVIGLSGAATDITDGKRLEQRLRESQRLEAVGQLAGGVAHDFNNLLTGIHGFTEFARSRLPEGSEVHADLGEVVQFSKRAAELVSQLLAFSRNQELERRVLDPNDLVNRLSKMLRRIIGEHMELDFVASPTIAPVLADAGQLEQVLLNLAVNARDAMPEGGKLVIEISETVFDSTARHLDLSPGPYVVIAVSDSGSGMDDATQRRVFEPFFTTKPVGQGTGLGLATAYGIVRQHGGTMTVYSAPGVGTTFKVILPRASDAVAPRHAEVVPEIGGGHETILLVEDEPAVRAVAERALRAKGYHLHIATDPVEAEELFRLHGSAVDVLVTDVIMPGGTGPDLFGRLEPEKPELRVLYMSGYARGAISRATIVPEGASFLQKPFEPDGLVSKVREVLDAA